jgi:hypothetical protein
LRERPDGYPILHALSLLTEPHIRSESIQRDLVSSIRCRASSFT